MHSKPAHASWKFFFAIAAVLSGATCAAAPVSLTTEDYPPFNFMSDKGDAVTGISTDIIAAMMKRGHVETTVAIYPWERALGMARSEDHTCVYSTIRTKDREHQYKWIGPLDSDSLVVFARADRDIHLTSLKDARRYTVGTYIGSAANTILQAQNIPFETTQEDSLNLRKMEVDRIDLWVANFRTGLYKAKREGVAVKPVLVLGRSRDFQMWLACSKTMPDATVSRLNHILKNMAADGTIDHILVKYK